MQFSSEHWSWVVKPHHTAWSSCKSSHTSKPGSNLEQYVTRTGRKWLYTLVYRDTGSRWRNWSLSTGSGPVLKVSLELGSRISWTMVAKVFKVPPLGEEGWETSVDDFAKSTSAQHNTGSLGAFHVLSWRHEDETPWQKRIFRSRSQMSRMFPVYQVGFIPKKISHLVLLKPFEPSRRHSLAESFSDFTQIWNATGSLMTRHSHFSLLFVIHGRCSLWKVGCLQHRPSFHQWRATCNTHWCSTIACIKTFWTVCLKHRDLWGDQLCSVYWQTASTHNQSEAVFVLSKVRLFELEINTHPDKSTTPFLVSPTLLTFSAAWMS